MKGVHTFIHNKTGLICTYNNKDIDNMCDTLLISIDEVTEEQAKMFIVTYEYLEASNRREMSSSFMRVMNWSLIDQRYKALKRKFKIPNMLALEYRFDDETYQKIVSLNDLDYKVWFHDEISSTDPLLLVSKILALNNIRNALLEKRGLPEGPSIRKHTSPKDVLTANSSNQRVGSYTYKDIKGLNGPLGNSAVPPAQAGDIAIKEPKEHTLSPCVKQVKTWKAQFIKDVLVAKYDDLRNSVFKSARLGHDFHLFRHIVLYDAYKSWLLKEFPQVSLRKESHFRTWVKDTCCVKGDTENYSFQEHKVVVKGTSTRSTKLYYHLLPREELKRVWLSLTGCEKYGEVIQCFGCEKQDSVWVFSDQVDKGLCENCKVGYFEEHLDLPKGKLCLITT